MFYSIQMTERSKSFLCFYALEGNKIFTFRRLVMGLKVAPFIATRSMQLILNQRSFDDWIQALQEEDLKKELMKHSLASLVYIYIDDLLISSPKNLGTKFHLVLLDFVIDMLGSNGFKINKRK